MIGEVGLLSIRYWVHLFLSTLWIGGLVTLVFGLGLDWHHYTHSLSKGSFLDVFKSSLLLFGTGCLFSVLSQMGFFAYLTIHRIFLGMFGSVSLWNKVQVMIVAFVFFDLVYFRYMAFAHRGESFIVFFLLPLLLLGVSYGIALWKKKETNHYALVPTFFFMFVITTLEWTPVLRENAFQWLVMMGAALIICNAYQVLKLHRILQKNTRAV